jgi:galactan 5-O-arabinofuranosyltransferase
MDEVEDDAGASAAAGGLRALWARHRRRAGAAGLELLVAVGVAVGFTYWARTLTDDPMQRIGQVSALAGLQFRFAVVAVVLLGALVATVRGRFARFRPVVLRVACAGFAGLASALVAGALVFALRGTVWPLNGQYGDTGQLATWAMDIMHGKGIEPFYPPAFPYLLAWWSEAFTGHNAWHGLQQLEILSTALYGPTAYAAWRLTLRPPWALAMVVVGAMPLIAPYKPYTNIVLVLLLPLFARFVRGMRRAPDRGLRRNAVGAVLAGIGFGVMFLVYSGWYVWAAPGMLVAAAAAVPWVRGRRDRLVSLGYAACGAVVAFLVSAANLIPLLTAAGAGTTDRYAYFDTYIEPTYIAMFKFNLPAGATTLTWPPPGELGGVGVFTLLLLTGLGVALALGPRKPLVMTAAAFTAGAWLMRMWFAQHMARDHAVQLYPRTTVLMLYCLLVLGVYAAKLASERTLAVREMTARRGRVVAVAALASMTLLTAMIGSSTGNRFLPTSPSAHTAGSESWNAQRLRQPGGGCSPYWAKNQGRGDCDEPSSKAIPNPSPSDHLTKVNVNYLIGVMVGD